MDAAMMRKSMEEMWEAYNQRDIDGWIGFCAEDISVRNLANLRINGRSEFKDYVRGLVRLLIGRQGHGRTHHCRRQPCSGRVASRGHSRWDGALWVGSLGGPPGLRLGRFMSRS